MYTSKHTRLLIAVAQVSKLQSAVVPYSVEVLALDLQMYSKNLAQHPLKTTRRTLHRKSE